MPAVLIYGLNRKEWVTIMKRKDNSKKIVVSVLLLLVMISVAVYGVAVYHGTPHGNDYIEMGD